MTVRKRRKFSRQRGSWTHGHGAKKKWRGKGNKGGAGMAGTGKRADQKKPSIWKEEYFGRRFFKPKGPKIIINPVNVSYIDENLDKLLEKKLITKEKDFYVIDLKKLGHNKLLGKGKIKNKLMITAEYASANVIEAVKKAGGEIKVKEQEEAKKLTEKKEGKVKEEVKAE